MNVQDLRKPLLPRKAWDNLRSYDRAYYRAYAAAYSGDSQIVLAAPEQAEAPRARRGGYRGDQLGYALW